MAPTLEGAERRIGISAVQNANVFTALSNPPVRFYTSPEVLPGQLRFGAPICPSQNRP